MTVDTVSISWKRTSRNLEGSSWKSCKFGIFGTKMIHGKRLSFMSNTSQSERGPKSIVSVASFVSMVNGMFFCQSRKMYLVTVLANSKVVASKR